MKLLKLTVAIIALGAIVVSCKEDQKEKAQKQLVVYSTYVDSVSNVAAEDIAMNWEIIESDYQKYKAEVSEAIVSVKENSEVQAAIDITTAQYEALKIKVQAEIAKIEINKSK